MLGITQLFHHWTGASRVADLAERVAGRSRMAVWQRVVQALPQLGPTEGRGYLRARAGGIVREETERLAQQEGPAVARLQAQIEAAALELLIRSISTQLGQQRPHSVRRAA